MIIAYDTILVLSEAIQKAGSTDRLQIKNALLSLEPVEGVTGKISFDANGDRIQKEAVILQFKNREIVYIKTFKSE